MLGNGCGEKGHNEQEEPAESQQFDHMRWVDSLAHGYSSQQEGSPQEYDEVKHGARSVSF